MIEKIKKFLENKFSVLYHSFKLHLSSLRRVDFNKDHYVPQFILREFQIPTKHKWTYVYRRNENIQEKPIKKVAQKLGFYIAKTRGAKRNTNFIDKNMYHTLETNMAPVLQELKSVTVDVSLDPEKESLIAEFVAHQYTRTPAFYEVAEALLLVLMVDKGISKDELTRSYLKNIIENNPHHISSSDIKRRLVSDTKLKNHESICRLVSLLVSIFIMETIYKKEFKLIKPKNDRFFVCSDNPVAILNTENHSLFHITWWDLKEDEIAIFMPLSKELGVIYTNGGYAGQLDTIEEEFVDALNTSVMGAALNEIYCHKNDVDIKNRFDATSFLDT